MSQSQPLRIEYTEYGSLGTARTINSLLWFVNNRTLEQRALGYLAKYQEKYGLKLYAFVFQGNHYHLNCQFTGYNRSEFYRDLNARLAEAVRYCVAEFPGGPLFERRYAEQALPSNADIEEYFFYCALQPINAGLVERLSDYPAYNSFFDAISGVKRKYKVIDWSGFNKRRRSDPAVKIKDFTTVFTLTYDRLPGYEELTDKEYRQVMYKKFEDRAAKIIAERKAKGYHCPSSKELKLQTPGGKPRITKKSQRYDRRPLVLTHSTELRKRYLSWYFEIYSAYKKAVQRYFLGEVEVSFPARTYRPPGYCVGR